MQMVMKSATSRKSLVATMQQPVTLMEQQRTTTDLAIMQTLDMIAMALA
jgi:uncharacterized protein YqiB (DUF1249 family)